LINDLANLIAFKYISAGYYAVATVEDPSTQAEAERLYKPYLMIIEKWNNALKKFDQVALVPHQKSFVRQHDLSKIWYSSLKSM
jgi:hypothetical protein